MQTFQTFCEAVQKGQTGFYPVDTDESFAKATIDMVAERDFSNGDEDGHGCSWVEFADRAPGELEDYPHVVFCQIDENVPGAVTQKDYRPITW